MFCRDPLYVGSPRNSLIRLISWPQPTELTIIDLANPFMNTDISENVLRASIEDCREVVPVRSPLTLDASGRVAAFQARSSMHVMHRVQTAFARGRTIERIAADSELQFR
jgi:hypothetical protein